MLGCGEGWEQACESALWDLIAYSLLPQGLEQLAKENTASGVLYAGWPSKRVDTYLAVFSIFIPIPARCMER